MNPVLNITHADLRIKLTEEIVFSFGEHKGSTGKKDDGKRDRSNTMMTLRLL